MALIKCPECLKEVSDQVENCIHCGYPLNAKDSDNITETKLKSNNESENKSVENNTNVSTNETDKQTNNGCTGCGIIIAVIFALIFIISMFSNSDSSSSSRYSDDYINNKEYRDNVNDIAGVYGEDAEDVDRMLQAIEDEMNK